MAINFADRIAARPDSYVARYSTLEAARAAAGRLDKTALIFEGLDGQLWVARRGRISKILKEMGLRYMGAICGNVFLAPRAA